MKNCHSCGHQNDKSMRFCVECGAIIETSPQMVVPLKPQDSVRTDSFEQPTVVAGRSAKSTNRSVAKYFVLGLVGIGLLLVVSAAGIATAIALTIYNAPEPKPLASKPKPIRGNPTPYSDNDPVVTPTPRTTATPVIDTSGPPTKNRTWVVATDRAWQVTDIRTIESEDFSVVATGTYRLEGIKRRVTARGINGHKSRRLFKQFKTGALLMRTHFADGTHSNIQAVSSGKYWKNYPTERGMLEFIVNDNESSNNSGRLKVRFKMISKDS